MPDETEGRRSAGRRRSSRTGPRVAIACHLNPDADALGSMLGLANLPASAGATGRVLVRERAARAAAVGLAAPAPIGSWRRRRSRRSPP